jgi:hypothetical protein
MLNLILEEGGLDAAPRAGITSGPGTWGTQNEASTLGQAGTNGQQLGIPRSLGNAGTSLLGTI